MTAAVAVAPVLPSSLLPSPPAPLEVVSSSSSLASARKRPLLPDEATASNKKPCNKKLQLRYDPDVPMSKEETAKWRREQRRKRNRESAAASRQRQRDRIHELEQQVDYYKQSLETINSKIQALEQKQQSSLTSAPTNASQESTPMIQDSLPVPPTTTASISPVTVKTEDNMADDISIVTPDHVARVDSPKPIVSFCPSPTTSTFMDFTGSEIVPELVSPKIELRGFSSTSSPQPLKMISRQAESRIINSIIISSFLKFYLNYFVGKVLRLAFESPPGHCTSPCDWSVPFILRSPLSHSLRREKDSLSTSLGYLLRSKTYPACVSPSKIIIPAVKITGTGGEMLKNPQDCFSGVTTTPTTIPDLVTSYPVKVDEELLQEALETPLDVDDILPVIADDEFGELMLDAVDWL